jgi:hypothetical protein
MSQSGFAVKDTQTGIVDVRTVGDTRISAQVNWLYTQAVVVTQGVPDEQIDAMFAEFAKDRWKVVPVRIEELN